MRLLINGRKKSYRSYCAVEITSAYRVKTVHFTSPDNPEGENRDCDCLEVRDMEGNVTYIGCQDPAKYDSMLENLAEKGYACVTDADMVLKNPDIGNVKDTTKLAYFLADTKNK